MMPDTAGRIRFLEAMDVSRETIARLDIYEALINKWNPSINLVAKSTISQLWSRHFLDSAQIYKISKHQNGHWIDLGSGAGFPGLIVAAMAKEAMPDMRFSFIESDQRKAVFLRTAGHEMGVNIDVIARRVEEIEFLAADVLSVRALASLDNLLQFAEMHLKPAGQAIFMKGATFRKEISEALENWTFQRDEYPSITDKAAVILSIGDIKRV